MPRLRLSGWPAGVTSVGGASGPLYGTFFLRFGRATGSASELYLAALATGLRAGLAGIVERGKAVPDPGYDVAVSVMGTLRRMVEIWRGDLGWPVALRSGSIQLQGPEQLRRAVPKWFPPSHYAPCHGRRWISPRWPASQATRRQ